MKTMWPSQKHNHPPMIWSVVEILHSKRLRDMQQLHLYTQLYLQKGVNFSTESVEVTDNHPHSHSHLLVILSVFQIPWFTKLTEENPQKKSHCHPRLPACHIYLSSGLYMTKNKICCLSKRVYKCTIKKHSGQTWWRQNCSCHIAWKWNRSKWCSVTSWSIKRQILSSESQLQKQTNKNYLWCDGIPLGYSSARSDLEHFWIADRMSLKNQHSLPVEKNVRPCSYQRSSFTITIYSSCWEATAGCKAAYECRTTHTQLKTDSGTHNSETLVNYSHWSIMSHKSIFNCVCLQY